MTSTTHHTGERRECAVEGCARPYRARGLCAQHYQKAWRRTPANTGTWRRSCAELDPAAVDRLVAGNPPEFYTGWERREAVRILRQQGYSYRQIAARIGTYHRMVHRDLTVLGLIGVAS